MNYLSFCCCSWLLVASTFAFNIMPMLWDSWFSVKFLKVVSVLQYSQLWVQCSFFNKLLCLSLLWITSKRSKFLIMGYNLSFKPFGIKSSVMQQVKKSLRDSYLVNFSFSRLSFSQSALCFSWWLVFLVIWCHLVCVFIDMCGSCSLFLPRPLAIVFHIFLLKCCCLFLPLD